jgi:peptidyl-prolyl cis-trans isomerase SurA
MCLPMMRVPNVWSGASRGGVLMAVLMSTAPVASAAQTATPAAATAPAQSAESTPRRMGESVAAIVNDQIISTYDLAQRMRLLIATSGVQPTEQTFPQFQREALVSLVDERLQLLELHRLEKQQKMDLVATKEEVEQELAGIAQGNNMTAEQFTSALSAQGINPETLREQLRASVSWQRWIRGRYGSRLRVGEDQIKAAQQRLVAAASKPQYQISEIMIDANRVGGMDKAVQGANQLVAQIQGGAPFPAVARQFSSLPTAASGGDAGWVSQGEVAAEVQTALDQMRPGQLSLPIPVRDGVYIVYLRDRRSGAGANLVALKQAAVALSAQASAQDIEAARTKLETVRAATTGCGDLEAAAAKTPGVVAGDLGEAEIKDLAEPFREAAQSLQPGQVSQPIRTSAGLHLVAVCGRRASGSEEISHDQIENRLYGQQLSMISRRYMRDLRNSATIETR